ncbi:basic salivary proline-rich protein 4-like [Zingiber officinale]|uniref:basic salivary proline-rich protein 4-like n=1 Tax=Zingiber officinale TaxID=94328 RepID=UPI001C4D89C2|nr:basic salivary proline-rich protein 4-like [Zingiber officinale]
MATLHQYCRCNSLFQIASFQFCLLLLFFRPTESQGPPPDDKPTGTPSGCSSPNEPQALTPPDDKPLGNPSRIRRPNMAAKPSRPSGCDFQHACKPKSPVSSPQAPPAKAYWSRNSNPPVDN